MKVIRYPLWFSVPSMIFAVGSLALLVLYQAELSSSYHRIEDFEFRQLQLVGNITASDLEASLRRGDPTGAQRSVERLRGDRDLSRAVLVDEQGVVLASTNYGDLDRPLSATPLADLHDLASSARTSRASALRISSDRRLLLAAFPVALATLPGKARPTRYGALLTSTSLEFPRLNARADARRRLASAALVLVFFCLLLWLLFRKALLDRMNRLVAATQRIADGDFDAPIQLHGNDELTHLSRALARMTQRLRKSTDELRRNEEHFRSLVENIGEAIFILDAELRYEYASPSVRRMLGIDPAAFIGVEAVRGIHPEDREDLLRRDRAVLEGRSPSEHFIVRARAAAGDWRCFENTVRLLPGGEGRPRLLVTSHDITTRVQAEEALRESEERFNSLFASISDGAWAVSADGETFLYGNPALERIYGRSLDEFRRDKNRWLELVHPDDLEIARRSMIQVNETGEADNQYRIVRPNGEVRWIHDRKQLIRDATGKVLRKGGLVTDITEAKLAEEERARLESQLRQTQKMEAIGTLAGGIAHDFNNLLTAINGYAELIYDALGEDHELINEVREIRAAGDRAASLTRQLLLFSRQNVTRTRVLDLNVVVTDLNRMLTRLIGEHITCETALSASPLLISADAGQIEQIIVNLVVNARDAMPEGGSLRVGTAAVRLAEPTAIGSETLAPGEYAVLSIADTGCGMSPAVLSRIFEPFFTTKEVGKGTGLGLATIYGIVKGRKGGVSVRSTENEGTTFDVYLPIAERPPADSAEIPASAAGTRGTETLLFVEDERMVREVGARILREQGYRVIEAVDGAEAIALAHRAGAALQLVVTDLVMPHMTGRELADRLLALHPALRFLFVSGYAERAAGGQSQLPPDAPFLQKPYSPHALAAKVREVLDSAAVPPLPQA